MIAKCIPLVRVGAVSHAHIVDLASDHALADTFQLRCEISQVRGMPAIRIDVAAAWDGRIQVGADLSEKIEVVADDRSDLREGRAARPANAGGS